MSTSAPSAHRRLDGLQAGRAVAATMVVVYHANNFVLPLRLYDGEIAWRGFGMGYAGVEFFFVLSGFIMVHVHARDFDRPERIPAFLSRRFFRIYPIYWVVLALLIAAYLAIGELAPAAARDPDKALADFLLLPGPDRPLLPVAWTLQHEVMFYLVFCLLLASRRAGFAVLAAWAVGCLVYGLAGGDAYPAAFLLSPYNILFLVGALVAAARAPLARPAVQATLAVGLCVFVVVGMSEQYLTPWSLTARTLVYGLAAALVVGALARRPFPVPRWIVGLGDASYAVYLVHLPAMNAAALLLAATALPRALDPLTMLVLLVGIALLAGVVVRRLVEAPLLARLERRTVALS